MKIGVISDTHGLLRPEACAALDGVQRILHAGDVGGPEIVEALSRIAPVTAVCGNVDRDRWGATLPATEVVEIAGISIYLLHDLAQLDLKPEAAGFRIVRVWPQPSAENEREKWCALLQSRKRRPTPVSVAGERWEIGDPVRTRVRRARAVGVAGQLFTRSFPTLGKGEGARLFIGLLIVRSPSPLIAKGARSGAPTLHLVTQSG